VTTIEDMKKEAREHGGASVRAHGIKVAVSYEPHTQIFMWMVDSCLSNEALAARRLNEISAAERSGQYWPPVSFGAKMLQDAEIFNPELPNGPVWSES